MGHESFEQKVSAFEFIVNMCTHTNTCTPWRAQSTRAGWEVMGMEAGRQRGTVVSPKVSQIEVQILSLDGTGHPQSQE